MERICVVNHVSLFCRSDLVGQLVHCDFCPLAFHMDCINPPLTTVPSGMWMCPNHAEHAEVIYLPWIFIISFLLSFFKSIFNLWIVNISEGSPSKVQCWLLLFPPICGQWPYLWLKSLNISPSVSTEELQFSKNASLIG